MDLSSIFVSIDNYILSLLQSKKSFFIKLRTIYKNSFGTEYIQANPEAVEAFVAGIAKALGFIETNREEALVIAAGKLEVTPEALDADLAGIGLPRSLSVLRILAFQETLQT